MPSHHDPENPEKGRGRREATLIHSDTSARSHRPRDWKPAGTHAPPQYTRPESQRWAEAGSAPDSSEMQRAVCTHGHSPPDHSWAHLSHIRYTLTPLCPHRRADIGSAGHTQRTEQTQVHTPTHIIEDTEHKYQLTHTQSHTCNTLTHILV